MIRRSFQTMTMRLMMILILVIHFVRMSQMSPIWIGTLLIVALRRLESVFMRTRITTTRLAIA
ncbi:hypothetical protein D3C71_2134280 [compost metagenome]